MSVYSNYRSSRNSRRTIVLDQNPKVLQMHTINPNIVMMHYAIRGPQVARAIELNEELQRGACKAFKEVIRADNGDCQAMHQKPMTYGRQLFALVLEPDLMESCQYPEDIKERAQTILLSLRGCSMGSYTEGEGMRAIQKQVARYISQRDGGIPVDYRNVVCTGGSALAAKEFLSLFICRTKGKMAGVMFPIPGYPLFSALVVLNGMVPVKYFLDEEHNWGLNIDELVRAYEQAKKICSPRVLVVINPGNPTGQVLTRSNIEQIIKFAYEHKLVLLADEVYQWNVYGKDVVFHSFRKVIVEMGEPYSKMELASLMSASKAFTAECGLRGGSIELFNFCPEVIALFIKLISSNLCFPTGGQVALSALVNPPRPGEISYELFKTEQQEIHESLSERAQLTYDTFRNMEGFKVTEIQGAFYAFPEIEIPPDAIKAASERNMKPDDFYVRELLEFTGVCVLAGSGFGQKAGTYHFRTTILPPVDKLKIMLEKIKNFNAQFLSIYR